MAFDVGLPKRLDCAEESRELYQQGPRRNRGRKLISKRQRMKVQ